MGSLAELAARSLSLPVVRRATDDTDWRAFVPTADRWLGAQGDTVFVDSGEPLEFLTQAAVALAAGCNVFLGSHRWTAVEREQARAIMAPGVVTRGHVMVATGGTTGGLRFAIHTGDTLLAAAHALQTHFSFGPIHSVCVLPVHHVGGFQQFIRALATGGSVLLLEWKSLEAGVRPTLPSGDVVLSLVPAQLVRLINDPAAVAWLRQFRAIFLGGAAAAPALLLQARELGVPLAPAYGMTETAAQFAAQRPAEFLAGARGLPLFPGVQVRTTKRATDDGPGRIEVITPSAFLGYWPLLRPPGAWRTDDLGFLDEHGSLHVVGRADQAINTGGEKVQPAEVEHALRQTGAFSEVTVLGISDRRWGQVVAAFYPEADQVDIGFVETQLRELLSAHKLPRRWIAVRDWPRNDRGKTDRAALRKLAPGAPG